MVRVGRHAQAEIIPPDNPGQGDDDQSPRRRAQGRPRDGAFEEGADPMGQFGEQHAGQPERGRGDGGRGRQQPTEMRRGVNQRHPGKRGDGIIRVADAPGRRHRVAGHGGDQAGDERPVTHPPDGQYFHGKDRPGQRRPEDRAEPGRHAGRQQGAHV